MTDKPDDHRSTAEKVLDLAEIPQNGSDLDRALHRLVRDHDREADEIARLEEELKASHLRKAAASRALVVLLSATETKDEHGTSKAVAVQGQRWNRDGVFTITLHGRDREASRRSVTIRFTDFATGVEYRPALVERIPEASE